MRKNYFFARDICHHWAGALIHMLSRNSRGHTCKSHLISFTEVVEQAVCSHSSGVFTSKVNPRHGIYSLKTVPISFPHDQKYSQHWQFLTTCKEKAGCGGHACHPSFSQRWVGAMSLGLLCAQPVFHITFGISLMIPELRSAGCLRKGEPTRIRNRASPFLAAQSSLARGMYWDCGDLNPFKASWQQILSESGHSPSCALCYRDNAEVRHRLQWARAVRA